MNPRIIIHLDMDAFFAQVEERESPQFKGKPVVVGADPAPKQVWYGAGPKGKTIMRATGRGVVATANYEARKFGIHSAMPISQAYSLCPNAVYLPPNFELYNKVSENIMRIVRGFSPLVEQTSLDEAYIDVSKNFTIVKKASEFDAWREAEKVARGMREEILAQEQLTCSCGVGPNKMIAKIACGMAKPNGVKVVESGEAAAFVEPLDVEKMPGIGRKTASILRSSDIRLVADLKKLSEHDLEDLFGVRGKEMYGRVRGIDEDPVVAAREVKSIGKEITFEKDTRDPELLIRTFEQICKQVAREILEQEFLFRQITVVCRFTGFETHTKSETLKEPSENEAVLRKEAMKLFLRFLLENRKLVRLIGLRVKF